MTLKRGQHRKYAQMEELRWRQSEQGQKIEEVFETLQQFMEGPEIEPKRRIGFPTSEAGTAEIE